MKVLDFLHDDQRKGLKLIPRVQSSCGETNMEENQSSEDEKWG
jgi:hypothetical protein